jgi:hypothetical protein
MRRQGCEETVWAAVQAAAVAVLMGLAAGAAPAQSFASAADVPRISNTGNFGAVAGGTAMPSGAEILARVAERNKERAAELERYESERTYTVEYAGTGGEHHAEIEVRAELLGPDEKKLMVVSETGSKFLCDKVLRKLVESEQEAGSQQNKAQMALSAENYSAAMAGEEGVVTPDGPVRAWVLRVTPKVDNKFTYRGTVWVSEDDAAVVKIEGEPAKGPSFWINRASFTTTYTRRGDVWLPMRNVSRSEVRLGGEATLTIDYGSYPFVETRVTASHTEIAANSTTH